MSKNSKTVVEKPAAKRGIGKKILTGVARADGSLSSSVVSVKYHRGCTKVC